MKTQLSKPACVKARYTDEYKEQALHLWRASGRSAAKVTAELGIRPPLLYRWERTERKPNEHEFCCRDLLRPAFPLCACKQGAFRNVHVPRELSQADAGRVRRFRLLPGVFVSVHGPIFAIAGAKRKWQYYPRRFCLTFVSVIQNIGLRELH